MDLKDAFHQVPLHPDSRPYTGTDTPIGIQQWKVVPMGWKHGIAYCQRNLEVGLALVSDIASGYIDDILVGTPLLGKDAVKEMLLQHDKDLRRTLDGLKAADFVASGPKCTFFIKEVEFCGHCLNEGGGDQAPTWSSFVFGEVGITQDNHRFVLLYVILQLLCCLCS